MIDITIDQNVSVMLKYAEYNDNRNSTAVGGWAPVSADKTISWLMATYKD